MGKILMGPTGNIIKGHVLDVNVEGFERALQAYEPRLYVRWNPRKIKGWGCWEIRYSPAEKTIYDYAVHEGNTYTRVEYVENNLIHHVLDCAYLNYDQLRKVKSMDVIANKDHWINHIDYHEKRLQEEAKEKLKAHFRDVYRDNKKQMSELKEAVRSGINPHRILAHWNEV